MNHHTAVIDKGSQIGKGTKIWHFSHISGTATIGKNCTIGQNVYIGDNVHIGDNVKIQNNVSVYEGVKIEDHVFIGPSVVFTNVINPRSFINRKKEYQRTVLQIGCSIGANSTIVCGNTIGSYSFVGAGSLVTKNIDSGYLYYGSPAKKIRSIKKDME